MVQPKKLRGVHQHPWGSWVAEIRHPLLKKRVRLRTFDTVDEAIRIYDQAAVILCGRSAKTNFPVPQATSPKKCYRQMHLQKWKPSLSSSDRLSEVLHAKFKKSTKTSSPSLTCLRLDTKNALIGVWQNRSGCTSESRWVTSVNLRESSLKTTDSRDDNVYKDISINCEGSKSVVGLSNDQYCFYDQRDEEERMALQMIEELLSQ